MELHRSATRRGHKPKAGRPFYLTKRDQRILEFIWKWKIAPTSVIYEACVKPESTPYSAYKIMEKLEKHGYVEAKFNDTEIFWVWQLTEKGFESIKRNLPELEEEGCLSENHKHDRHVLAFHLGEWIGRRPERILFFSEQELRRLSKDDYPDWVPRTKDHRPDGYTRVVGLQKSVTYAIEVELSLKSVSRYESVIQFYRHQRQVDRILWLVSDPQIKANILRAKDCVKDPSENLHLFVDLKEYMQKGLNAVAANERSENLFTLRENLRGLLGDFYGDILGNSRELNRVTVHYHPTKVIGKSKT